MRTLIQNIRYAVRVLWKAPVLTFSAILILGIGIGANTALFTVMNALLIEQLPVADPDRLVLFEVSAPEKFDYGSTSGSTKVDSSGRLRLTAFTYQSFIRLRENAAGLADVFAFSPFTLNVSADGRSDVVEGQLASGNYYTGLRLQAVAGRTITDADDTPSAPAVAVISHRFWHQRFGGSASVIGKQLTINNTAFTVIGVTPANFNGTSEVGSAQDITIPLAWEPKIQSDPKQSQLYARDNWWLRIMARLGPGTTIEQATAKLNTVFQQSVLEDRVARQIDAQKKGDTPIEALESQYYPQLKLKTGSRGQVDVREEYAPSLSLLLGGLMVVLLIVCISVANLQFSRRVDQQREIATRLALGASRWQIVRQMLIESVVLATIGGALGIVFAIWIKEVLLRVEDWGGGDLNALNTRLDWRVLGFTVLLSIATGVICGVVPAWKSANTDAKILLNLGSGARVTSRSLLSKVLIVTQIALSLALAIGAGLFFQTLYNLKRTETGFNAHNLLLVDISPASNGYEGEELAQLYPAMIERFNAIPGVSAATISRIPLLANTRFGRSIYLREALQAPPDANGRIRASGSVYANYVYENFLDVMQIGLLQGRPLERVDDSASPPVAIVSETFAKRFFPNESALGKRFTFNVKKPDAIEIVGIAKDTKYDMQRREIRPMVYLPWRQGMDQMFAATIELRTSNDPYSIVADVRKAVYEVDKNLPVSNIRTQEEQADKTLHAERLFARILGLFAVFALLLTAIGLYGVLAYSVKRRTNEIGLRIALGADRAAVLKMIIRQGIMVTLVGLVLGLILSYASEMYLEKTVKLSSMLYGVKVHDLSTYIAVAGLMFVVALVACWFPARRATKIDPIRALRNE